MRNRQRLGTSVTHLQCSKWGDILIGWTGLSILGLCTSKCVLFSRTLPILSTLRSPWQLRIAPIETHIKALCRGIVKINQSLFEGRWSDQKYSIVSLNTLLFPQQSYSHTVKSETAPWLIIEAMVMPIMIDNSRLLIQWIKGHGNRRNFYIAHASWRFGLQ